MSLLSRFIVLVERRRVVRAAGLWLALPALLACLLAAPASQAQTLTTASRLASSTATYTCPVIAQSSPTAAWAKLSADLQQVVSAPAMPRLS